MRHPLHFDRSYSAEMLRKKAQLSTDRVADSDRSLSGRRVIPLGTAEKDALPLKAARLS